MKGSVTVELGGEKRTLQFGYGALKIYCKLMATDIEGLDLIFQKGPRRIEATSTMIYAGLVNYSNIKEEIIDYNLAKVEHWLDEAEADVATKIIDALFETMSFAETEDTTGAKKKSPSRKSTSRQSKQGSSQTK